MNVLFVHNNFPAQYRYLTRALSRHKSVKMVAIGSSTSRSVPGVELRKYVLGASDLAGTHPFARRFDLECQRGEQVLYALSSLVASGFIPDVILAHPGWGETLPLRIMFPQARLLVYCEFFYGDQGRDVDFDPEFPKAGLDGHIGLKLKNATGLLALNDANFQGVRRPNGSVRPFLPSIGTRFRRFMRGLMLTWCGRSHQPSFGCLPDRN